MNHVPQVTIQAFQPVTGVELAMAGLFRADMVRDRHRRRAAHVEGALLHFAQLNDRVHMEDSSQQFSARRVGWAYGFAQIRAGGESFTLASASFV